jgi:colanic acid/amylovoran biosynthesis glycosyltransferase
VKTRNILIYKDTLLPPSETFILSQGEGLSEFKALYFGSKRVSGIEVPSERSFFISNGSRLGRCREILFKAFGLLPSPMHEMLGRLQPALVHAHFGPDGVMAATLAECLRIPLVVTFHGYDATSNDGSLYKMSFMHKKYLRRRQDLFRNGSLFIAVSQFIKLKLLELGVPEEKIFVHYIGIDTNKFEPTPQIHREPIVLFVGRLVEVKGCTYLIQAMKEVQASFPAAELVVIGDGPLRKQLENEAERSLKKFHFLGVQPPRVIKEWLNRARVFSVPSITAENGNAEGFGIVFAEAQAMGIPVASFLSGGIPEAVAHGETGLLAAERDVGGLAANITRLLSDEKLWRTMSQQARERVRERFDLKQQTTLLENIYKDVIAGYAGGAAKCQL